MARFTSYDSIEEMMQDMAAAEAAANDRTTPQQQAIGLGDYWMRPMEDVMLFGHVQDLDELVASELLHVTRFDRQSHPTAVGRAHRLLADVFGDADPLVTWLLGDPDPQLETLVESKLEQLRTIGEIVELSDEHWEEFVSTLNMLRDSNRRGYRFGPVWSLIVPDGELGSTHVSEMIPSCRAEFDRARDYGWDFRAMLADRVSWAEKLALTYRDDPAALYTREV